jgi:uncharacterized membrane protein YhaH (DUF805 family)
LIVLLAEEEQPMLGFLFGFHARLGRMHYFLATLALGAVTTAIFFVITRDAFQHTPRGMSPSLDDLLTWPTITVIIVFSWVAFTLQSMRIRDIGWDPVCIIPGWISFLIVDKLVASKIPAWSLGHEHHGTIAGSLVNLVLLLALLFWPSGEFEVPSAGGPSPKSNGASLPAAPLVRGAGAQFSRRAF